MDIYSDSNENAIKINDEPASEDDRPPRLPPRPPPRPRNTTNSEAGMINHVDFFPILFNGDGKLKKFLCDVLLFVYD